MDTVRVVTLNLWGTEEPLAARLRLVEEACRALSPDAICLQEVRQVPGRVDNTARTLADALGLHCFFAPATDWGGGTEGLAILSRLPMARTDVGELPHATAEERRIVVGAALDTPRGALPVFTTHLTYRLHDGHKREDQVAAVNAFTQGWSTELPRILCGDFNAVPHSDEIRFLRGLHSIPVGGVATRCYWQDAFERVQPDDKGFTWAARNPYTQRLGWLEPDRRLDYVFVSPMFRDGRALVEDCRIVLDSPDGDGVWPSDHLGLCADVRIAARAPRTAR